VHPVTAAANFTFRPDSFPHSRQPWLDALESSQPFAAASDEFDTGQDDSDPDAWPALKDLDEAFADLAASVVP
jgi:hypothetical protein